MPGLALPFPSVGFGDRPAEQAASSRVSPAAGAEHADADLVERCLTGSEVACAELFHRYYKRLMPVCLRYAQGPDQAKDILQDGFIRIFSKLGTYAGKGPLFGWMKRVVLNTAINHYHASVRERGALRIDRLEDPDDLGMAEPFAEEALSHLSADALLALVQELTPAYRMAFNLHVLDGWTHEEIAQELGITIGASKSNLARARARLMARVRALDGSFRYERRSA